MFSVNFGAKSAITQGFLPLGMPALTPVDLVGQNRELFLPDLVWIE